MSEKLDTPGVLCYNNFDSSNERQVRKMGEMTKAVRIETDSVTIQELAQLMVDNLQSDSLSGAAKKAWRAWRDGLFAGARKTGKGTASIIVPAGVAERWVEAGCPTLGEAKSMEQQVDDDAKRDWHLEEGRLADVAGLDR